MRTMIKTAMGVLLLTGMVTAPVMAESANSHGSQASQANEQGSSGQDASSQGERLSGSAIRDTVMGHRVTGAMADGSRYNEAYRVDGTIEGEDYTGQSTIEGDRMCLDYGSGETTCYQVRMVSDNRIEWLLDDKVVGEGTLSAIE